MMNGYAILLTVLGLTTVGVDAREKRSAPKDVTTPGAKVTSFDGLSESEKNSRVACATLVAMDNVLNRTGGIVSLPRSARVVRNPNTQR
jgi:hypothetical protein